MSTAPARPTETADLREALPYVLMKRGLYWCPNGQGYTGVLAEAGRYSEDEARAWHGHESDSTTMHLASECAEFAPACWPETQIKVLRAQRAAALAERDEARNLAYELKLAAAGGEDVPGSANLVTVEDVNRWRVEASQREESAIAQANRVKEVMLRFGLRFIRRETLLRSALAEREARIVALEGALKAAIAAWDKLPGDRHYSTKTIQIWMIDDLGPAFKALRAALSQGATDADPA